MNTFRIIYNLVSKIPLGKVTTYKKIADRLNIKDIRIIGYALHRNKDPDHIPCHRVIKSTGEIANGYAFGGKKAQLDRLRKENVVFLSKDRIDLSNSLYQLPYEKN